MFFTMLLPMLAAVPLRAQTSSKSSLEAKLALESSLEKRTQLVLSEALGTEDVIVIISAELQEQEKKSPEIMPGIPEKDRMGEPSLSSTLTMVKRLSAKLILDKSVSEEDAQLARKLAAGLLGLPPDRQDLISVERMSFRKTRPLTFADIFLPPNLWSLAWLLLVGLVAAVTVSMFLAPISRSARAFVEAFSSRAASASEQDYRPERPEKEAPEAAKPQEAQRQAQSPDGRKPPFWFLDTANAQSLAFILKSRTAEDLTIVLNYAPGALAARLAETLYPMSVEALAALPRVTLMPESRIRALETEIMSALDYVVGGEDKAVGIINTLDESVQEKALAAFGRLDPALSRRLGASIVKLSDIAALDPAQTQVLARRLPMRVTAAALKGSPHAAAFLAKLSGGMQERFRQELELTRPLPLEAYKAERASVVEVLRQMRREGILPPGPRAAPAPKPAAQAPSPRPETPKPAASQPAPAPKQ